MERTKFLTQLRVQEIRRLHQGSHPHRQHDHHRLQTHLRSLDTTPPGTNNTKTLTYPQNPLEPRTEVSGLSKCSPNIFCSPVPAEIGKICDGKPVPHEVTVLERPDNVLWVAGVIQFTEAGRCACVTQRGNDVLRCFQ